MVRLSKLIQVITLLAIVVFQTVAGQPFAAGSETLASYHPSIPGQPDGTVGGVNLSSSVHCQSTAKDITCGQIALLGTALPFGFLVPPGWIARANSNDTPTGWGTALDPPPPRV